MHRIDVHNHIFPTQYLAAAKANGKIGEVLSSQPDMIDWTPATSLAAMDRNEVQKAITSVSTPGVWWGDLALARTLARQCNEFSAEMARNHPGRFGFFASLPLPDVEASLAEIAYAMDELGATGILVMTSYGDRWPGDVAFAPVFRELNRRKATVFFHPTVADCCRGLIPDVGPSMIEYPIDSTRAIVSLLSSGTFSACPDVTCIFSHGGGVLPMLAARIARIADRSPVCGPRLPHGAMHELQQLRFDVASATSPPALAALLQFAPIENILFGSDFPYQDFETAIEGLRDGGLTGARLAAIESGNIQSVLTRSAASK
jgi:predicted TIM-barrel fold metal-dependent hydrolase